MEELEKETQVSPDKKEVIPIKRYAAIGFTVFLTVCACTLFFFVLYRFTGFSEGWKTVFAVLRPFVIGAVLAYLLGPVEKYFEALYQRGLEKRKKPPKRPKKIARNLSILTTEVIMIAVVSGMFALVIPQLVSSISDMVTTFPARADAMMDSLDKFANSDHQFAVYAQQLLTNFNDYVENWFKNSFVPQAREYVTTVTSGVYSGVRSVFDVLLGIIVSVYVMAEKETFISQSKKITYAVFRTKAANNIMTVTRRLNFTFSEFVTGSLVDALIIGVLCYLGSVIIGLPYAPLIAVVVGVTNIIPFFGPIIGAVPCVILVAIAEPLKGLYCLIMILVVQQIDANIVKPKILGDSIGISSFWIIFAITVGGGLFGFMGMLLGVPVFAVIYYLADVLICKLLGRKGLPASTLAYRRLNRVDLETKELSYDEITVPKSPGEIRREAENEQQGAAPAKKSILKRLRKKH